MRAQPLFLVPFLLVGCASAPRSRPTAVARKDSVIVAISRFEVPGDELTPDQLRSLAPRVRAIQLEQGATTIAPGDTFSLHRFAIRVLDSAGATLGRVRLYDYGVTPGAVALAPPAIVRGVAEGVSQIRLSYPRRLWVGRADPPVETFLRVTVRARPARTAGSAGSDALTDRVRADYGVEVAMPDSGPRRVSLQYVVLWRAQPEWCRRPCGAGSPGLPEGSPADSMKARHRDAEIRGNTFIGSSSNGLTYGMEMDHRNRRLMVLDQTVSYGNRDSAAVVLVDRVDGVGGPPVVVRIFRIPALLATDTVRVARNASPLAGLELPELVRDAVRLSPVAREFIDNPPPRLPPPPPPGRRAN